MLCCAAQFMSPFQTFLNSTYESDQQQHLVRLRWSLTCKILPVPLEYKNTKHLIFQERCFFVSSRAWDKEKFWVPMRNRASDRRIPRSDALPLSHRDSTVSEVYYEVHMTRVLHTVRINHFDLNRIREMVSFELDKEMLSAFRSPQKYSSCEKPMSQWWLRRALLGASRTLSKFKRRTKFSSTQEVWSNPWKKGPLE